MHRPDQPAIVLASGSATRAAMLRAAGIRFEIDPARVDEIELKKATGPSTPPADLALMLAREKAKEVSCRRPEALVLGGDQVLSLGAEVLSKAKSGDEARTALKRLSGRTHALHSAAALAKAGAIVWSAVDEARLTMRGLSDEFLDLYVQSAGDALTTSVGAYQIEGLGITLFERVEGQYATILGLPLVPLLAELRRQGVCV